MDLHPDDSLIDELGGTGELAKLCGVSPGAVAQWRTNGIPRLRRYQITALLERAGKPVPARLNSEAA